MWSEVVRVARFVSVSLAVVVVILFLTWVVYIIGFILGLWGDFGR